MHEPSRALLWSASESEKELTRKSGQLQPFTAVFPLRNAWANLHLLGQPDAFLAEAAVGETFAVGAARASL